MERTHRIFVLCLVVFGCAALQLPDYMKPCSRSDPNFNACALQQGREAMSRMVQGDDKYGVPVLDPLLIRKLTTTYNGFTATTRNSTVVGVKGVVIEDISFDFDKQLVRVAFMFPTLQFNGLYEMSGKLAGLPISGKGDYDLFLSGLSGNYSTNYTLARLRDGQLHAMPQSYAVDFDIRGLKVHFGNLFKGNRLLGNSINDFINENWRLVVEELGKPVLTSLGSIVHEVLLNLAEKIPYDELFAA
ncbi:hypothetical protein B7P43_G07893 [Cryptotermes secundus]|uniref:Protein takeout n=1 Tax=Cryptotermes secundus TaxID=105785 RepID=A0A2J7QTI1_9NEOP|nr:protein takeout isoform X1 [Cryptotermes secundus]PNF31887.1 hypothetical protein B7P43_G07893 [Cryptotermes secundus]